MNKSRPNIGVTGPNKGGTVAWWFTRWAVFLQGGRAIRIQPGNDNPDSELHGLIIGGGADINPIYYGKNAPKNNLNKKKKGLVAALRNILNVIFFPIIFLMRALFSIPSSSAQNEQRDELEFHLLEQAVEKGWPVLGICRGAQLINVHFGGSLHSDITSFYTEVPYVHTIWPKKKVVVREGTKLSTILPFHRLWVNALHHQAVDRLGENIRIAAQEDNGVVQAIEHRKLPFVIGVQWHPEYLPQIPAQSQIFKTLVEQSQKVQKH